MKHSHPSKSWPVHGWVGLGLILLSWAANWSMTGLRTHLFFFPLWLGYCLTVDAMVFKRKGTSMLARNRKGYWMLFCISIPAWWLFEIINWRTQNWFYDGRQFFSDFQFFLLSSISFSTVMPAVFGTAELVGASKWLKKIPHGPSIPINRKTLIFLFFTGCLMLALLLFWPLYFFAFVWLSVYFILEPLNHWWGKPSLLKYLGYGDWRPVFALCTGCLICGFFWEMWNFYSYPKWIYQVPFVDFLHIFEMPLLGFLGYFPFSLELFALYYFVTGVLMRGRPNGLLQIFENN